MHAHTHETEQSGRCAGDGPGSLLEDKPGVYDVAIAAVTAHAAQQSQAGTPVQILQSEIYTLLGKLVSTEDIDKQYRDSLLSYIELAGVSEQSNAPLSILPLLCCEAVGGAAGDALPAAAAWRALHLAAKLLDDVEDGEAALLASQPKVASAVNMATGLFSAAGLALLQLAPSVQHRALSKFYQTILLMSSGQHADLSGSAYTFDGYMNMIAAKSGRFFSLATSFGAWCGTSNEQYVALLDNFGFNVGIFLQIADDYLDWHNPDSSELTGGKATLPVCFVRSVGTASQIVHLEQLLLQVQSGDARATEACIEVRSLASELGADAYMMAEMIRHKVRALSSLDELDRLGSDTRPLRDWLQALSAFIPG